MDPASLSSLVAELLVAIHLLSGYAPPTVPPIVHVVPQSAIQEQFCRRPCRVRAAYDATLGVFIDENLDIAKNTFDRSILLHHGHADGFALFLVLFDRRRRGGVWRVGAGKSQR